MRESEEDKNVFSDLPPTDAAHSTYPDYAQPSLQEQYYSWEINPWSYPRAMRRRRQKEGVLNVISVLLLILGMLELITAAIYISLPTIMAGGDWVDLKGSVEDEEHNPIEGVNITIVGNNLHVVTNDAGDFTFYNLPAGELHIRANKFGYKNLTQTFCLIRGVAEDIRFTLSNGTGDEETNENDARISIYGTSILVGLFAIFALVGSYHIRERRFFSVALVGSILGNGMCMFIGEFLLINALLIASFLIGIISLSLLIRARKTLERK